MTRKVITVVIDDGVRLVAYTSSSLPTDLIPSSLIINAAGDDVTAGFVRDSCMCVYIIGSGVL